jgi:hypothetical protein
MVVKVAHDVVDAHDWGGGIAAQNVSLVGDILLREVESWPTAKAMDMIVGVVWFFVAREESESPRGDREMREATTE